MFNWLAACHLFLLMCFGFPLLKNKWECQEGKLTDIHDYLQSAPTAGWTLDCVFHCTWKPLGMLWRNVASNAKLNHKTLLGTQRYQQWTYCSSNSVVPVAAADSTECWKLSRADLLQLPVTASGVLWVTQSACFSLSLLRSFPEQMVHLRHNLVQKSWWVMSGLDQWTLSMHTTQTLGTAAFRQSHIFQ